MLRLVQSANDGPLTDAAGPAPEVKLVGSPLQCISVPPLNVFHVVYIVVASLLSRLRGYGHGTTNNRNSVLWLLWKQTELKYMQINPPKKQVGSQINVYLRGLNF